MKKILLILLLLIPIIAGAEITAIDTLEHDTTVGYYNSLVQIDATHYMLAYYGVGSYGYLKVFALDGNYEISVVDTFKSTFTSEYQYNSLIKIDDTHFILASAGGGDDGFITTYSMDGNYQISEINEIEHNATYGINNSLVKIDATHFILAYTGYLDDGYITSFSIDESYNITEINQVEHDGDTGKYSSLVKIDDTHFILAYAGTADDGYIKTFSINGSYEITAIDTLEHSDNITASYNALMQIDAAHYLLIYNDAVSGGFAKTFSINESYEISPIDTVQVNQYRCLGSSLIKLGDNAALLTAAMNNTDGYIQIIQWDDNYQITAVDTDRLLFDDSDAKTDWTSLVLIDNTHAIVAYTGTGDDGFLQTFLIPDYSGASGWTGKIMGVTDPASVMGIDVENIQSVMGVE